MSGAPEKKKTGATSEISFSLEDYLETIHNLAKVSGHAHASEIAEKMGVKKPTATEALRSLKSKKLIDYEPYRPVTLTRHGQKLADKITTRHVVLTRFLIDLLNLSGGEADENACRIEHALSEAAFEGLRLMHSYFNENDKGKTDLKKFHRWMAKQRKVD